MIENYQFMYIEIYKINAIIVILHQKFLYQHLIPFFVFIIPIVNSLLTHINLNGYCAPINENLNSNNHQIEVKKHTFIKK